MRFAYWLWLMVVCPWAFAQPPSYFRQFTERDGLSDNRVRAITADHRGGIWVGTANGLNRFDGYTFRQFLPNTAQPHRSVSNEFINQLATSPAGKIWIATQNGLNCFDPIQGQFQSWFGGDKGGNALPNSVVQDVYVASEDSIWLACDHRDPCLFQPSTGVFRTFPWQQFVRKVLPQTAPNAYLTLHAIRPKAQGELWLLSNVGLFSLDFVHGTFQQYHSSASTLAPTLDCPVTLLFGTWDQDVWGLNACDGHLHRLPLPLPATVTGGLRHVRDIVPYGNGNLILGNRGLFWLGHPGATIVEVTHDESSGSPWPGRGCTRGFVDAHGALWVGSDQGLWLAPPQARHFRYSRLLPSDATERVENSFRHLGTRQPGMQLSLDFYGHQLFAEGFHQVPTVHSLPSRAFLLHADAEGNAWVGGGNQIFQVQARPFRLLPFALDPPGWNPSPKGYFVGLAQDGSGRFWFAHSHDGLVVFDPRDGSYWLPDSSDGMIGTSLSSIQFDAARQTMWIGSYDYGLFRYDIATGRFSLLQHQPTRPEAGPGAYIVTGLALGSSGDLWLATDPGGVSRLVVDSLGHERFRHYSMSEGLPSNRVVSLVMDGKGRIWAGTLGGLACINPSNHSVRSFGTSDGLIADFLDMPLGTTAQGEVVVGGKLGVQYFSPDSILATTFPAQIYLSDFLLFDQPLPDSLWPQVGSPLVLQHDQNFFSFGFTTDQVHAASHMEYSYRLKGLDPDWNEVGLRHRGSYTNVPPGDYTLEVRARNHGAWGPPLLQVPLQVLPPFWATWWFRSLGILLVAGVVAGAFHLRIRQVRRNTAREGQFRQQLARTEMAALRAQMNPHFIFNCLSSINRFILVNQPEEASLFLHKFGLLIRHILDHSRNETVPLSKELEAIQLYVQLEQMRFANKFQFRLDVSPDIQAEWIEIPPLLIQPYIENAIWHGLMHQKGAGLLLLKIDRQGPELVVCIEDNGIGRAMAAELKSRSANLQKSHGMTVTAERLAALHTLFGTASTVETLDLFHPDGSPAGTRILLTLNLPTG